MRDDLTHLHLTNQLKVFVANRCEMPPPLDGVTCGAHVKMTADAWAAMLCKFSSPIGFAKKISVFVLKWKFSEFDPSSQTHYITSDIIESLGFETTVVRLLFKPLLCEPMSVMTNWAGFASMG